MIFSAPSWKSLLSIFFAANCSVYNNSEEGNRNKMPVLFSKVAILIREQQRATYYYLEHAACI
jgi:hypothetical protein